jgi:hypothetical protein
MTKKSFNNIPDSPSRRRLLGQLAGLAGTGALGLALSRIAWGSTTAEVTGSPLRLICFSFPNGCQPELWNFENVLAPLAGVRQHVHVFRGLRNRPSEASGGDQHEQGGVSLFSGGMSTDGIRSTRPSLDYVTGRYANSTLLKSPYVAGVSVGSAGGVMRSLSWRRRSWDSSGQALPMRTDPYGTLQELFGNDPGRKVIREQSLHVVDSVRAEYSRLAGAQGLLSSQARTSLEQQMERLFGLETKLRDQIAAHNDTGVCTVGESLGSKVLVDRALKMYYSSYPAIFSSHMGLLVSAFQCDLVRTASLMFGNSGDDYFHSDWKYGDHDTSHYFNPDTESIYRKYRVLHMETVRKLVDQLQATADTDGTTLLDNTVIIVGSEFGDGRAHIISPQPHLVIGGQNFLQPGKEWDLNLSAEPTQLYATIEQLFRKRYAAEVAQAGDRTAPNFTDAPLSGLLRST